MPFSVYLQSGRHDANTPNGENIDAQLAQELNQMSLKEREALYEEIHGVEAAMHETPELIQQSLFEMEMEIQRIGDKPAYNVAVQRSPEYVKGKKFRLMFLRADQFDVIRAARRLVRYMEELRTLFGDEVLGRSLSYHDLDKNTRSCLHTGAYQWLPCRDRAGRVVLANLQPMILERCYKNAIDMVKMFTYFSMSLLEDDEETQRKGMVSIFYTIGKKNQDFDFELHSKMPRTLDWIPLRVACVHYCSDNIYMTRFAKLLMSAMTKNLRVRVRLHGGASHTECQYSLLTFGVPTHSLPINYEGEMKVANHTKWVTKMKIRDEYRRQGKSFGDVVDLPSSDDVLLGRGKTFQDHSGSIKLRNLVERHLKDYCDALKIGKTKVTWDVVKAIQAAGGRFLKLRADGWWEVVSDEAARVKVAMTFRTSLSLKNRAKQQEADDQEVVPRFVESTNGKRFRVMSEGSDGCFGFCAS